MRAISFHVGLGVAISVANISVQMFAEPNDGWRRPRARGLDQFSESRASDSEPVVLANFGLARTTWDVNPEWE